MGLEAIEQFRILFLDRKNHLIADEVQQSGTVDHTPVYPREVVKRALELSASAIILVHNHPTRPISITLDHAYYPLNHFNFPACRSVRHCGILGSVLWLVELGTPWHIGVGFEGDQSPL